MIAIKTEFDGEKIVLPQELRGRSPGEVIVLYEPVDTDDSDDALRKEIDAITPSNKELLERSRRIKPDFSWYPADEPSK